MTDFIRSALSEAERTISNFLNNSKNIELMAEAISLMTDASKSGHALFSCGNGGSMCDAIHFAEELTGRFRKNRPAVKASAICDPGHMTCVANDFGYEYVFSRYLEGWACEGDVLVGISTSGNSKNIIEAVKTAKSRGVKTIGLLGKDGGELKDMVDIPLVVPAMIADRVQEVHIKIIHTFIEGIERNLFPENYK